MQTRTRWFAALTTIALAVILEPTDPVFYAFFEINDLEHFPQA